MEAVVSTQHEAHTSTPQTLMQEQELQHMPQAA